MAASDDLVNAKIEAAEARGDTKIARLEGKIDNLAAIIGGRFDLLSVDMKNSTKASNELKDSVRESKWVLFGTIIGATFALAALLVTVITYGDAIFSRGMSVRDVVQTTVKETREQLKQEAVTPQK